MKTKNFSQQRNEVTKRGGITIFNLLLCWFLGCFVVQNLPGAPTNSPAPATRSITTDTNGVLTGPSTNFFTTNAAAMLKVMPTNQPYILVIGDSRSPSENGGWPQSVKTNSVWDNRAAWIGTAVAGKKLEAYVTNFSNEVTPYLTGNSNQCWVAIWAGYNDLGSMSVSAVQTNLLSIWTSLRTRGCKIIQFAGGLSVTNTLEDFIRTNSSYYDAFVNATNFSSGDGVHPNAAGAVEIANLFLGATTNLIPKIVVPARAFDGETIFRATTKSGNAGRMFGKVILDSNPALDAAGIIPGIWVKTPTEENQMGIWYSPLTLASGRQDLNISIRGTKVATFSDEKVLDLFQNGLRYFALGDATSSDNERLFLFFDGAKFNLTSSAAGTGSFRPVQIGASGGYIYFPGYPSSFIGINTTNPIAAFDVNGGIHASGELSVSQLNLAVTNVVADYVVPTNVFLILVDSATNSKVIWNGSTAATTNRWFSVKAINADANVVVTVTNSVGNIDRLTNAIAISNYTAVDFHAATTNLWTR